MPFYKIDAGRSRIKLFFEDIPSLQMRTSLKENHWRWDPQEKCWYTHSNPTTVKFAEKICPSSGTATDHRSTEQLGFLLKGTCGKGAIWMLSPFGDLVIGGFGKIDGYDFNQMEQSPWHQFRTEIKQISIINGITVIGKRAFYDLPNLEKVELPPSLILIDERAFSKCSKLQFIELPQTLKSIGAQAFRDCHALHEIHIPLSVTKLGDECFKNWSEEQRIFRSFKDPKTGIVTEKTLCVQADTTQIYFEDFVTVTSNNYCINNRHDFESIQALVHILRRDGSLKTVTIPAGYCHMCKKYFIGYWQFENLRKIGLILCRIVQENNSKNSSFGNFYDNLSAESILKQSGYSVGASEDLTDEQRRQVLVCLMESDICSKQKITSHLSWLIQSREGRYDMFNAVCKWRSDREFVDAYKMGTGRVVAMRALRVRR